jgi:hypothetical protein
MARNAVLRWVDGRGWLVLSASHDDEIRALVLARASADGGVAYVAMGGIEAEKALADMEDLGASAGYLVDVLAEDDTAIRQKLAEAGVIVIPDGVDALDARDALMGAAASGIRDAFANGAVVLAEGGGAAVFGAWVLLDSRKTAAGLNWLESALVLPGVTSVSASDEAQMVLSIQPAAIAVGIGPGSALALGPDGEVETWGNKQVTIALGRDYSAE